MADLREDAFNRANSILRSINGGRGESSFRSREDPAASESLIRNTHVDIARILTTRAATDTVGREGFTRAGRSISDHPEVLGFKTQKEFQQAYRTVGAQNEAGARAVRSIVNNGEMTTLRTRSVGPVINFERGDGYQARFKPDGEFVGFAGPRR